MGRVQDAQRLLSKQGARLARKAGQISPTWLPKVSGGRWVPSPSPILGFLWENRPGPFNCTNHTSSNANPMDSSHPLYTRTMRAAANFDDSKLHWVVTVPVNLHKKPCIRHRVKRRFKHAFKEELKASGWDEQGVPLRKTGNEQLSGALALLISSQDPWAAREIAWNDVVKLSRWTLDTFLEQRAKTKPESPPQAHGAGLGGKQSQTAPAPSQRRGQGRSVVIGNLTRSVDELVLRREFEQLGTVDRIRIVTDRSSGRSKGHAFLTFSTPSEASCAIASHNGRLIGGQPIHVSWPQDTPLQSDHRNGNAVRRLSLPNHKPSNRLSAATAG